MAWLSDTESGPSARFNVDPAFSGIYELVDGTEIAVGWADLVDGSLAHAIDMDETGATLNPSTVWTSTATNGTSTGAMNCEGWTTTGDGMQVAVTGLSSQTDGKWTENKNNDCTIFARLYCFQVQ
jgi:hypothetical protein